MNQISREAETEAESPKNDENNEDGPKHNEIELQVKRAPTGNCAYPIPKSSDRQQIGPA